MTDQPNPILPEDPRKAEPGRGAPGNNHYGVQTAQNTNVNPPDAEIPSNVDVEQNIEQLEAFREQEEGAKLDTTAGYVIDESGRLDNLAIEPQMYVEER